MSELALDRAVSAFEFHESARDLEVSATELNDPALDRRVLPPKDLEVGDAGTCREVEGS